jgi:hypothetical protein
VSLVGVGRRNQITASTSPNIIVRIRILIDLTTIATLIYSEL